MHKITVGTVVACAMVVGLRADAQTSPATTAHNGMAMPTQPSPVVTVVTGPLGSRSASGSATVTGQRVQLVWSGDTPGSVRAWDVRSGPCGAGGLPVTATPTYQSIAVDAKGNGSAAVTLNTPLNFSEAFHIAVRASSDVNAEQIACGSLASGSHMAGSPAMHQVSGMSNHASAGHDSAGMDHSKMPGMTPARAAMDSTMGAMDHSSMDHSAMSAGAGTAKPLSDSASIMLMAIHNRMMADPVIQERVKTDPTLQRMLEKMHGMEVSVSHERGAGLHGTNSTPEAGVKRSAVDPAQKPTVAAPKKSPAKAPAKAAAKEPTKPATPPMPGMDHSKMPAMKKPPV